MISCKLNCVNEKPVKIFRLKGKATFKDRPVKVVFHSQPDWDSVLRSFNDKKKKEK